MSWAKRMKMDRESHIEKKEFGFKLSFIPKLFTLNRCLSHKEKCEFFEFKWGPSEEPCKGQH